MSKTRFLTLLTVLLLAINLLLIGFITYNRTKGPMHPGPKEHIIKKLNFDKEQVAKYEGIIKEHQAVFIPANEKMSALKNELYHSLSKQESSSQADSIILLIGDTQEQIEKINLHHFTEIKAICNTAQLEDFERLLDELARLFKTSNKKRKDND